MRIYKELETLGFFKWYCTQYSGLVYQEYKPVYDDLPLDNIIRTELNACVFKFFREKYNYFSSPTESDNDTTKTYDWLITKNLGSGKKFIGFIGYKNSYEEAEFECIKKLIENTKKEL